MELIGYWRGDSCALCALESGKMESDCVCVEQASPAVFNTHPNASLFSKDYFHVFLCLKLDWKHAIK